MTKKEKGSVGRSIAEASIPALFFRCALPGILGALLPPLSGLADNLFLSRLGSAESGAAGVVFPVFALLQTVGFTLGTGAGSILSRSLGAKKRKQATSIASLSFILSLSCGLLILAVGLIFRENIPLWFGANAETLQPAKRYIVGMSFSAPVVCGSFVLGNLLRAEGKTAWATLGTGVGVLTTVLLEALFLFRFSGVFL